MLLLFGDTLKQAERGRRLFLLTQPPSSEQRRVVYLLWRAELVAWTGSLLCQGSLLCLAWPAEGAGGACSATSQSRVGQWAWAGEQSRGEPSQSLLPVRSPLGAFKEAVAEPDSSVGVGSCLKEPCSPPRMWGASLKGSGERGPVRVQWVTAHLQRVILWGRPYS